MESSPSNRFESTEPYSVLNRKERSRELAQKRRTTYKSLMKDLADELPFSKDVVSQVDYNSRLRLALCFFRMKSVAPQKETTSTALSLHQGLLQDLITESLDGFLTVIGGDGSLVYISESIHKHLGLFQSEHIGLSAYDIIHEDDHANVRTALTDAESKVLDRPGRLVECSFFCRMKCSRFKVSNTAAKCPGYKLVFVSGHYKIQGSESCLFAIVRPVSPPSILEITMEGNVFVTHYNMHMKCIFFDGRLPHLMGYEKKDLINHVPFEFHHHEDVEANLECSRGLMEKGEGLSGYYRYMTKYGSFVWVQSRATMMFDSRTGKPSYIVCMNYIISREKGEKSLEERKNKEEATNALESARSHDPFPVPRDDGKSMNPFNDPETSLGSIKSPMSLTESLTSVPVSRSISPDSVQSGSPVPPPSSSSLSVVSNKSRDFPSVTDGGYYSVSTSATTPTVLSPTPSFADSGFTTDYGTYSPQVVEEGAAVKYELLSPTNTKSPPSLISLLASGPPMDVKSLQYNPPSTASRPHSSSSPMVGFDPYFGHSAAAGGMSSSSGKIPDLGSKSLLRPHEAPPQLVGDQGRDLMMSHPVPPAPLPPPSSSAQYPVGNRSGYYQVPFDFTATMIQPGAPPHLGSFVTAHHQPVPIGIGSGFSLPILNAEDVQFLNASGGKPFFRSYY